MNDRIIKYVLLLPAFLIVIATTFYPLTYSFVTSFREWQLTRQREPQDFVGFDNYARAFTDEHFISSFITTVIFVISSVFLTVVLSLLLALLLRRTGRLHSFTRAILILPFAMSPALIGVSFRFMFNPEFGVLSKGIGFLWSGSHNVAWLADPKLSMAVLVLTDVWHWTPYMTFMCMGGLAALPRATEEAALMDGASKARILFDIIIPQLRNVILVITILKTIFALKMFDQVVTLTGGGPGRATETLAYFVYTIGFKWFDMGYASALAYILTAIMMLISIWYVRLLLQERKMASA